MSKSLQIRYQKRKEAYARQYRQAMFQALRKEKADVIRSIEKNGITATLANLQALITGKRVSSVLTKMYTAISPVEAKNVYTTTYRREGYRAKSFGDAIDWKADIIAWLEQNLLSAAVDPITRTIRKEVQQVLTEVIQDGGSYWDAVRAIQATTGIDRSRAFLITRTESNRAMNLGHQTGANKLPFVTRKMWMAATDARTRGRDKDKADHINLNGVEIEEHELFVDPRNGKALAYPGDTSNGAVAANVANCRCSIGVSGKRDANGQLILR